MTTTGTLRVRLFHGLRVWRPDGSRVKDDAWSTAKTRDLVRILALSSGRVVRTERVLADLWPGVDAARARNSLRTATSTIRTVTGTRCVVRTPEGLVLVAAWVDTAEFLSLADQVRRAADAGDGALARRQARAALALRPATFRAANDTSRWAREARVELGRARARLLRDAVAAADVAGLAADAGELAGQLAALDPTSDLAHRALMAAHAAAGDAGRAVAVYHAYADRLAARFGVDPPTQTRALLDRILSTGGP